MIIVQQKPLAKVLEAVEGKKTILVAGCRVCAAICRAGGAEEVAALAAALEEAGREQGLVRTVEQGTAPRQCEANSLKSLDEPMARAEVCVSLACGIGVQNVADRYPGTKVIPGLDTMFAGGSPSARAWEDRCRMCGDCVLGETGGICPVTRCAKGLLNGPCGGAEKDRCEVDPDMFCAWSLIYSRLEAQGQLDRMENVLPPKNWAAGGAGLRSFVREE